MRILITGALGHIGSRVIREIPAAYPRAEIIMIDNLTTQRYCSLFDLSADGNYRFIEADVLEMDLGQVIESSDVVLHLSAITDAASSFKNKEQVENVNFNGTAKVAKACSSVGTPMIHISSTSVYGTQLDIVSEDCSSHDLKPQSPYAETKLKEERFLQKLGESGELQFVICRFGTICGVSPGMRFHTAVNKFCWQAVMGVPLTVWRTALYQKRPYLTLSDAVAAVKFIIRTGLYDQRVYNVLTENLTVNSILEFIKKNLPIQKIQYVDTEIMNQLSYKVSTKRFRKQGFQFTGSVEESITDTIEVLKAAGGKRVE